jgi:rhodanese-related sulfurtransferase/DNA-binding transcriptional ArsR family regulator
MNQDRKFKERLYAQFARLGKALSSPRRLEILELLAQGERTVDSLARETALSLANVSQHLKALRAACLVESRKQGLFVWYRLADPIVFELSRTLRTVAESRLAELERIVSEQFVDRSEAEAVSIKELLRRGRSGDVVVLDTRPAGEYAAGHIPGALSMPVDDLEKRLKELPRKKSYVAYCRGPYCIYADRAVEILKANGRRAQRLREGFPDWRAAGLPVESQTAPAAAV